MIFKPLLLFCTKNNCLNHYSLMSLVQKNIHLLSMHILLAKALYIRPALLKLKDFNMVTKAEQEVKSGKQVAKAHWQCMACGSDFWGPKKAPKCPKCNAEGFDLKELNADGIPIQDVKNAISGGQDVSYEGENTIIHGSNKAAQINLDYSRAAIGRADDIAAEMFERDMTSAIQSDVSNKVKAKAAESKATLIEQELKLKEMEHADGDDMAPQNPFSPNSVSASSLIQSISGLPEDEREWWLSQLKDPQAVYGLATLLNPPTQKMQGGIPYPQQNPLMSLMGVRQQMEQMQPQQQQPQQQQGGEETSSMLELAQAFKILHDTAVDSVPKPPDHSESDKRLEEALHELKDTQEKMNDRYYALRVEQLEGGGGGITEERLEAILATKLASANKSPLQSLQELKATMTEIDGLRGMLEPKTDIIHGEPIDEWVKKHTLEREMQEDKLKHEERIASQNAKAAKWAVAKNLLSDGIKANIAARTRDGGELEEEEEKEEEKVPDVLRRKKVTLVR
jgi:hypothetical protein